MVTLKYFSWVRERVGFDEETVELPSEVRTLGDLMEWQTGRGEHYAQIFEDAEFIRLAVDMKHVTDMGLSLAGVKEIAIFPAMTAG